MQKKTYFVIGIMLFSAIFMVAHALAWNFNGHSVECVGFWDKNVDTSAITDCTITGPIQSDGSYASSFSVTFWCVNPNNADNFSPPKQTNVSVMSGSESNQNGRKVKGKVNLVVHIDGSGAFDSSVCNQGNSSPGGNGQWVVAAWLPSSAFTGIVTTSQNNGSPRTEVYSCGTGSLFADGTNLSDHLDEILAALANHVPLSSLGLTYNCTIVPTT